jgi:hypothetical protein
MIFYRYLSRTLYKGDKIALYILDSLLSSQKSFCSEDVCLTFANNLDLDHRHVKPTKKRPTFVGLLINYNTNTLAYCANDSESAKPASDSTYQRFFRN